MCGEDGHLPHNSEVLSRVNAATKHAYNTWLLVDKVGRSCIVDSIPASRATPPQNPSNHAGSKPDKDLRGLHCSTRLYHTGENRRVQEVKLPPYVKQRGNVYWFRRRVPEELIPLVGRVEFAESLRTSDLALVHKRAAYRNAEVEVAFEKARYDLKRRAGTVLMSGSWRTLP